jgi:hypothetical protein
MNGITWQEIALALVAVFEIVVRLTPTDKDNTILAKIIWVLNKVIPNNKSKGGTH